MKEWIGYYKDALTSELSENVALNSKGWKQSTYSNHEGKIKNSLKRVVMQETKNIQNNKKYFKTKSKRKSILWVMENYK